MSSTRDKAAQLSGMYYNEGLDLARIRDLTGAVDSLKLSLQFDKTNIQARNLLGLIYYETGETVAALREWVISMNFQPAGNLAAGYVQDVRRDSARLAAQNQTIRRYNEALRACREGNDDVAALDLRRIIGKNPKFVKAILLLSLIDIKEGRYAQAKRLLRRAAAIDRSNPMVLRYLREIDEQTGTTTSLDFRTSDISDRKKKKREAGNREEDLDRETAEVRQGRGKFRENPSWVNFLNILFGLVIGILAAWFVVRPAVRAGVSRNANDQIVEYTTTIAADEDRISSLQKQLDDMNSSVSSAQDQAQSYQNTADSYDNLIRAYSDYQNGNYEQAGDEIAKVDVSLLSTSAGEIYDSVHDSIMNEAYGIYVSNAGNAFYLQDWKTAAEQYEKAVAIVPDDYDSLNLLGQAYENMGDREKAIETYQKIVDTFPDTRRSEYAEALIEQLGGTVKKSDSSTDASNDSTDTAGEGASDAAGADASGGDTSGTDASGTDTGGTDMTGQEATGTDATGADTYGEDAGAAG